MEATGPYSLPLADFLAAQGYPDSAVNPAKTHAFANTLWGTRSEPGRTKTDKAAAKLIARYAQTMQPGLGRRHRPKCADCKR